MQKHGEGSLQIIIMLSARMSLSMEEDEAQPLVVLVVEEENPVVVRTVAAGGVGLCGQKRNNILFLVVQDSKPCIPCDYFQLMDDLLSSL